MPAGRYAILGGDGQPVGTEEFRCAPGPVGWRYFSEVDTSSPTPHHETIDVVVDADWRPVRLRVATGEHEILLEAVGDTLTGYRDRVAVEIPWDPEMHVDYLTPATSLVTTRRLAGTAEIDVVSIAPFTLEPRQTRRRYELLGENEVETPAGRFDATRWRFTALDSGWTADLWVAGDVVVAFPRRFELEWYEPGATGPRPLP